MTVRYMLFKDGRDRIKDTQWFVHQFVEEALQPLDLNWIKINGSSLLGASVTGVKTCGGAEFVMVEDGFILDEWVEVTPDNLLGEI